MFGERINKKTTRGWFFYLFSPQTYLNIISYLYEIVRVIKIPSHGN